MKTGSLLLPHWRKKMFRRRKNEGAFDDAPSTPTQTKVIESKPVNYEGKVRGTKHSVEEVKPDLRGTLPISKSTTTDTYPLPDGEIDIYSVDLRIWERVKNYIDGLGGGGGGGPHTHDGLYAPTDHEHDLEDHTHDGYVSQTIMSIIKTAMEWSRRGLHRRRTLTQKPHPR